MPQINAGKRPLVAVAQRVPLVVNELLTLPEHTCALTVLSGVSVAQSFCVLLLLFVFLVSLPSFHNGYLHSSCFINDDCP